MDYYFSSARNQASLEYDLEATVLTYLLKLNEHCMITRIANPGYRVAK